MVVSPSYQGRGLVNLIGELEMRLTGSSASPGLEPGLAELIPDAPTYVLVLLDGMGHHQLQSREAATLRAAATGRLDAPFPTTTTVSLSSIATGLPPRGHGVLGHLMWLPEIGEVVNVLKWVTLYGEAVEYPTETLLPSPNLWERLAGGGIEPVAVQPGDFATTPLTRALYRGCRFEPAWSVGELIEATVVLSRQPRRLIFAYLPQVDFAAHVWGQHSQQYREAVAAVDTAWSQLVARLPAGVVAIATADHGHLDYPEEVKRLVRDPRYRQLTFYGDPRAVLVRGDGDLIRTVADETGATLVEGDEMDSLWGDGDAHPAYGERRPDAVLLANRGEVIIPRGFDKRLVGYHGGLLPEEVEVPLIVG